jgi:nitrate/TMAO reductase-like tetraheme cytochrome c subunit
VSGVLIITLVAIELFGFEANPYVGIITYMVLPTVFALGLVLIVWGIVRERKRAPGGRFPVIDLNVKRTRQLVLSFLVILSMSVVILATGTSGAIHFMESNTFCGTMCHTVMSPQYTAFQRSPHASVHCVDCHVAPGASGFVDAKINGTWQLVSAALELYHKPIPTPVHNLPPTDVTCEQCHWRGQYHGIMPKMITRFADDEANTETKTILMMNVGGPDFKETLGIHWHTDPDIRIRYRSDESRRQIHEVELTLPDGTVKRYFARSTDDSAPSEWRTMQCIDCHNRPAHIFSGAEEAVDLALERDFIRTDLPYIHREAVRAIRGEYTSHEQARREIPVVITGFYETEYPQLASERREDIDAAGRVLADVYENNVFPSMKIDWGTYPSFNGHDEATGCFRCHAGDHATEDGETITVDCRACHTIVAWNEASPQILEMLRGRGASPAARPMTSPLDRD